MSNMLYLSYDGDGCGKKVGRAIIANDENALREISAKIDLGHQIVNHWVAEHGGKVISGGGDEGSFKVPEEAADSVEELRKDHFYATGITISVGVGKSLSEAGRSLLAAKFRGKDQVARYDESIEKDIEKARKRVKKGKATQEEYKLAEAYLEKKEENMADPKLKEEQDCQHCDESDGQDPDHCKYCHDADATEGEEDCPYCAQAAQEEAEGIDDCPYCKEQDVEDDCPYCEESVTEEVPAGEGQAALSDETLEAPIEPPGAQADEIQANDSVIPEEGAHSKEALQAIAQQIQVETADGRPDEKAMASQIDDTAIVGDNMQGNVSRPDNFDSNSPGDVGLPGQDPTSKPDEESPDLAGVLQEGLDDGADEIKKDKVRTMIGQALQGFKASKDVLEAAKVQAPGFYAASIAMLAAMINMADMLGLKGNGAMAGEQPEGQDEWSDPFPAHPDQGGEQKPVHAAPQGVAAEDPKADRQ